VDDEVVFESGWPSLGRQRLLGINNKLTKRHAVMMGGDELLTLEIEGCHTWVGYRMLSHADAGEKIRGIRRGAIIGLISQGTSGSE
jgi:hypothetical protein